MKGGEEIYAEVGHGDAEQGDDEPPERGFAAVEGYEVEEESYQGGGLFRIPAPVAAPGFVCPYGACNYAETKQIYRPTEQAEGTGSHGIRITD